MNTSVNFSNPFVLIFLCGTVATFLINHFLEFIDFRARSKNGGSIPPVLQKIPLATETFDTEKLKNISAYEDAKYFKWCISSVIMMALDLALVLFGFYPFVFNFICGLTGFPSTIANSFCAFFLFMLITAVPSFVLAIPFSLYDEFILEKKFGFSNMTWKLWITDQLKGIVVGLILISLLTFIAAVAFVKFATSWWFILAAIMIAFTFIMQVVYPKFIAPLFNKFSPLEDGEAKDKIMAILDRVGFKNGGLFVMDASKRSGHSNAYFSGFGKTKRIVLYDTLLKSLTPDELAAVLGHELGHFKLHHITKRLFIMIPMEFVITFLLYKMAHLVNMYNAFGFVNITAQNVAGAQFIGMFLAAMLWSSISEIISPVSNIFSRKQEYQADAFGADVCGSPEPLITGLIKLNSENLSELIPPKLYVFWNYSHPTLVERIEKLKGRHNARVSGKYQSDTIQPFEMNNIPLILDVVVPMWSPPQEDMEFRRFYVEHIVRNNLFENDYHFELIENGSFCASAFFARKADVCKADEWYSVESRKYSENLLSSTKIGKSYIELMDDKVRSYMNDDDIQLTLYVSRKKGCGSKLLNKLCEELRAQGWKNLYLWTDCECNWQWYTDHGYELLSTDVYKPFSSEDEDYLTYIFRKKL
jgi:STE24 endopeptidase